MACMEHECTECNFVAFNNWPSMSCPECGARCRATFDEEPDRDYGYEDEIGETDEDEDEQ